MAEALHIPVGKARKHSDNLFGSLLNGQFGRRLREEFVCPADEFLLHRLGREVLQGKRQVLQADGFNGESRTCVAFRNARVTFKTFLAKYFSSHKTVTYVRLCAETGDSGRIAEDNTDVVKHGGLLDERDVEMQLGMTLRSLQGLVTHEAGVGEENVAERGVVAAVFIYE